MKGSAGRPGVDDSREVTAFAGSCAQSSPGPGGPDTRVWAAQSGATIKDLQDRLGHASSAAAMRYQHLATDRGRVIAANISAQAEAVFAAGAHRGHDAGPEAGNA